MDFGDKLNQLHSKLKRRVPKSTRRFFCSLVEHENPKSKPKGYSWNRATIEQ